MPTADHRPAPLSSCRPPKTQSYTDFIGQNYACTTLVLPTPSSMNQCCVPIHAPPHNPIKFAHRPSQMPPEPLNSPHEASSSPIPPGAKRGRPRGALRGKGWRSLCSPEPVWLCLMMDSTERFRADAMIDDRRAKTLSSYAGDTALPGGRIDDDDKTIEDTAVRPDTTSPR